MPRNLEYVPYGYDAPEADNERHLDILRSF